MLAVEGLANYDPVFNPKMPPVVLGRILSIISYCPGPGFPNPFTIKLPEFVFPDIVTPFFDI